MKTAYMWILPGNNGQARVPKAAMEGVHRASVTSICTYSTNDLLRVLVQSHRRLIRPYNANGKNLKDRSNPDRVCPYQSGSRGTTFQRQSMCHICYASEGLGKEQGTIMQVPQEYRRNLLPGPTLPALLLALYFFPLLPLSSLRGKAVDITLLCFTAVRETAPEVSLPAWKCTTGTRPLSGRTDFSGPKFRQLADGTDA